MGATGLAGGCCVGYTFFSLSTFMLCIRCREVSVPISLAARSTLAYLLASPSAPWRSSNSAEMVEFELQLLCGPRLFGLIAAHGFVDFSAPSLLPVYAIAAIPLGSIPTTASFCALSLMHFARDLGARLSFALHGLAGLVFLVDQNLSFMLMTVYSLIYHIPSAHRPHRGAMQRHARI